MLCCDQHNVGNSKKPSALQSKLAGKIGELFVYDVVVSELFLISFHVFMILMDIQTALVARKM